MSEDIPRQTASYVRQRLRERGISPDIRFGQNFLIDLNLLELLLRSAELAADELVLEIGTGTGSLTARLAQLAGWVVTVEVDRELAALARESLAATENVTLLVQDALKGKNRMDPRVLDAIRQQIELHQLAGYKLVANLPYAVATPVISNLLLLEDHPQRMVVTIQKEVADRILARPGTKDYGALSVWVQSVAKPQLIRVLPPEVFWPRPKVHSAIIRIDPDSAKRAELGDVPFFHEMVRELFQHRRKVLRTVLRKVAGGGLTADDVALLYGQLGWEPDVRAEQLSVVEIQRLVGKLREVLRERA